MPETNHRRPALIPPHGGTLVDRTLRGSLRAYYENGNLSPPSRIRRNTLMDSCLWRKSSLSGTDS